MRNDQGGKLSHAYDLAAQQCNEELATAKRELRAVVDVEDFSDADATTKARRVAFLVLEHRELLKLATQTRQISR